MSKPQQISVCLEKDIEFIIGELPTPKTTSRRDAYGWDIHGNLWKHFDSKLFPGVRNKIIVVRELFPIWFPNGLPKTKYDHRPGHTEVISDEGLTLDAAVAQFTNQEERMI